MAVLLLAAYQLSGCGKPADAPSAANDEQVGLAYFEPVQEVWNLEFNHDSGARGDYLFPEIVSGGAALCDLTGNGLLDVYYVQSGSLTEPIDGPPNRLYHNRGDGRFEDVTAESGAQDRRYGVGVAAGDFNNDGSLDLYVTNVGRNTLLRNDGDGYFEDITESAGVGDTGWGTSAAFADLNLSGSLDIFVVNYIRWSLDSEMPCTSHAGRRDYCMPNAYEAPARDVVYRNNGDETFDDISESAGLGAALGNGLGIVCTDVNQNGWIDVFVANDQLPNHLWMNQGDETFAEQAMELGCAVDGRGRAKAGMGVSSADVTGNGFEDLLVVNLTGETDTLYANHGTYFFDETLNTGLAAISRGYTRFGVALHDFDNDNWLDVYHANGRVDTNDDSQSGDDPYAEINLFSRGDAEGRFEEVLPRGGTAQPLVATSRAAAFGDIDKDGGIDIVVVNRDGPAYVLRNIAPVRGNWIMFRVLDEHGRDAFNARVTVQIGDRTVHREVRSAYSYLAANDPKVHFGLGDADSVSAVTVSWLDGTTQEFGDFDANQTVTISR